MNENKNVAHEIGWEDQITTDGEPFITLEEGDYDFTVSGFERGRFPGSKKIPACNKAVLTLTVDTPEGTANVKYDLILWSSLEWKISEFFRAIGQKKAGEAFVPRWNQVVNATGRAHFKPRKYMKDGEERTANDVSKFYDYEPKPNYTMQSQQQGAASWQGKF